METINSNQSEELEVNTDIETIESFWNGCPVCGMDEWCGTDGCPMDPQ